ncbi:MAG: PorV/PorQ family protein [candidate division Zixibacteria bacterium]|nr:PorV/PorQ family protein [candidate division Zixibacteria bacterium]
MRKILTISLALILVLSAVLLAESDKKLGTAGAQALRIPVGSRGTSMGGTVVANSYGVDALYWNPAGAAMQQGTEVMLSHLDYFADMDVEYAAITTNIEGFGTLGASVKVLSVGDILKTSWDDEQGDAGEYFNPSVSVIGLSYARQFTDRVSFGFTAAFINQKVDLATAKGVVFDFGFGYNPQWQGLRFGVVIKNLGPSMRFDGPGFQFNVIPDDNDPNSAAKTVRKQSTNFELPSSIQLGAAWDLLNTNELHSMEVTGLFQANNFSNDEFKGGVEYAYNDIFFLRGGYIASQQDNYIYGASLGAGLKVSLGETSNIAFDYSWVDNEFFDAHSYFTVKFAF